MGYRIAYWRPLGIRCHRLRRRGDYSRLYAGDTPPRHWSEGPCVASIRLDMEKPNHAVSFLTSKQFTMEFHDLKPTYPPTPWMIQQDFFDDNGEGIKTELARCELRAHDRRLICSSRMIARLRHEQINLFELLGAAPAMLELLVKLYKSDNLTGVDRELVENLIKKFFTQIPKQHENQD